MIMSRQDTFPKITNESVPITFLRVLSKPYLRTTALQCIASILRNFFLLQYKAAFLPGRIPVTRVDHPLDRQIPFLPGRVNTYLDFVAFWVRTVGFLLRIYGRGAFEPVRNFLRTMGGLYAFAAELYRKNLSTTKRPFYIRHPRFLLIHLVDPHLMCIPSLHVMIVIRTYTLFREIIKNLHEENRLTSQAEELYRGAIGITEAVLYVKQHSVNCISAAMYAMSRFDPALFPQAEAERFVSDLFSDAENLVPLNEKEKSRQQAAEEIREYILSLYRRFVVSGNAPDWTEPLLNFLKEQAVN